MGPNFWQVKKNGSAPFIEGADRSGEGQGGLVMEQKPPMQATVGSQQSAAVVHLSPTPEHVLPGGMFEHTSAPMAPLGSQ
jgi:hypothetical protein